MALQSTGKMLALQAAQDMADAERAMLSAPVRSAPLQSPAASSPLGGMNAAFNNGFQIINDVANRPQEQAKQNHELAKFQSEEIGRQNKAGYETGLAQLNNQLHQLTPQQYKTQLVELANKFNQTGQLQESYKQGEDLRQFYGQLTDPQKQGQQLVQDNLSNVVAKEQEEFNNYAQQVYTAHKVQPEVADWVTNKQYAGSKEYDEYVKGQEESTGFKLSPVFEAFRRAGVVNPNKALLASVLQRGKTGQGWFGDDDKGQFSNVDGIVKDVVALRDSHKQGALDAEKALSPLREQLTARHKQYQQQAEGFIQGYSGNNLRRVLGGEKDLPVQKWTPLNAFDSSELYALPEVTETGNNGNSGNNNEGTSGTGDTTLTDETTKTVDLTSTTPQQGRLDKITDLLPTGGEVANFTHSLLNRGTLKPINQVKEEKYTQEYVDQFRQDPRFNPRGGIFKWDEAQVAASKLAKEKLAKEIQSAAQVTSDIPDSYETTNYSQEMDAALTKATGKLWQAESGQHGYDSIAGGDQQNASSMTIGSLLEREPTVNKDFPKGTSAAGKYQINRIALKEIAEDMNLPMDTKFTPEIQDKMFRHYALKQPAIKQYVEAAKKGIVPPSVTTKAINAFTKKWAGFQNQEGKGAYDGVNGNKATAGADIVEKILQQLAQEQS